MEPEDISASDDSPEYNAVNFGIAAVGMLVLALEAVMLRRVEQIHARFGGSLPGLTQLELDLRLPHAMLSIAGSLLLLAAVLLRTRRYRPEGCAFLGWSGSTAMVGAFVCGFPLYVALWSLKGAGFTFGMLF